MMTSVRPDPSRPAGLVVAAALVGALTWGAAPPAAQAAFLIEQAQSTAPGVDGDTPSIDSEEVVLRWLDKSTARVDQVTVAVGETVALGGLTVAVRACRRTAPDQQPEHAAFLEIREETDPPDAEALFRGWMFASSPSLSAMEHPVYDVWVLECADASEDMGGDADDAGEAEAGGPPLPPSLPPSRQ
jgi:hypothetical protein